MASSGVFVLLSDRASLALYLHRGLYGFLMSPIHRVGAISSRPRHFHALADYACIREGTHVFFFLERQIVYGGQAVGQADYGSFWLNGPLSPLGLAAVAPLCWDESSRYSPTSEAGVFRVRLADGDADRCQPYLIRFHDGLQLRGKSISSDELYWRLGDYGYPLPSNSIQGMSFCTLTPGETEIALELLSTMPEQQFPLDCGNASDLLGKPVFSAAFGVRDLVAAFAAGFFVNEAHLEASIIANPDLLPVSMRPGAGDCICRQVPVSPFKPAQMDRADICYFSSGNVINRGTLPNVVIELKNKHASQNAVDQVVRYLRWLHRVAGAQARSIRAYVFAPSFAKTVRVPEFTDQIELMTPVGPFKR
jgi:hypothetical protein